MSVNGNWYWGSFAKEYVTESCDCMEFVRRRLLDARDNGCKVLGGGNDLIGGCDDRYGHGMVHKAKGVGEMLATCPFHDGADAAVVFQ